MSPSAQSSVRKPLVAALTSADLINGLRITQGNHDAIVERARHVFSRQEFNRLVDESGIPRRGSLSTETARPWLEGYFPLLKRAHETSAAMQYLLNRAKTYYESCKRKRKRRIEQGYAAAEKNKRDKATIKRLLKQRGKGFVEEVEEEVDAAGPDRLVTRRCPSSIRYSLYSV